MKRSTTRWTTAFATAALLVLPAAGRAQTPPATSSPSKPTTQAPAAAPQQGGAAQEHIRQAQTALKDVQVASLEAKAKTKVSELQRHLNALEKSASATASKTKPTWATNVAAIDKILTELIGPATASAPAGATGTTGKEKAAAIKIDDATKAKLMEVRTHVTAFAAAMSGSPASSSPEPSSEPAAAPAQPSATPPAQAPTEPAAPSTPAQPPASTPAQPAASTPRPRAPRRRHPRRSQVPNRRSLRRR